MKYQAQNPIQFTPPPTTLTPYNISPKPLKPFSTSPINVCLPKYPPQFSLLAAIHLFISSHDEIKDFCSMDKKTGRRYVRRVCLATIIIVHVRIVPPSLTFVVITTYSQRVFIKYIPKIQNTNIFCDYELTNCTSICTQP